MIVVVGQPIYRESEGAAMVDGLPARVALAAAAHGRSVQLVGKAGEDEAGDAVVLALAKGGVGHVALLREAGRPTARAASSRDDDIDAGSDTGGVFEPDQEPAARDSPLDPVTTGPSLEAADIELALQYLTEFAVLVLADPAAQDVLRVVAKAASWADSRLIVVVPPGGTVPEDLPADAIAFEAPDSDPDGVFASLVGSFAAGLDDGGDPADSFRSSVDLGGWTPAVAEPAVD